MNEEKMFTLLDAQEKFAKSIYNQIWNLLDKKDRTPSENEDLVLSAYASLYHWKQIGTEVNLQRGYWMVSKVYQCLGIVDQAVNWAEKSQDITERYSDDMEDFDLAYAQEGLARAYAQSGDFKRAKRHYDQAAIFGELIQDPEDKLVFDKDFQGGDWFKLKPE